MHADPTPRDGTPHQAVAAGAASGARAASGSGTPARARRDRCPGVLRPWLAEDGALVRLRLPGGEVTAGTLRALAAVAETYGDGRVWLTARANLQLRGLARQDPAPAGDRLAPSGDPGAPAGDRLLDPEAELLDPEAEAALLDTGLVPAPAHERVRNVMASPLTGISGGRADLRPVVRALDAALCADPVLATLPGRFLFVLDDGRGDLLARRRDLGVVARDAGHGQLVLGSHALGPVVPLAEVPTVLAELARAFLTARGEGEDAPWHVDELPATGPGQRPWHHPYAVRAAGPGAYAGSGVASGHPPGGISEQLPAGAVAPGWAHHRCPHGLDRAGVAALTAGLADDTRLVVTPWRGVLVPRADGTG